MDKKHEELINDVASPDPILAVTQAWQAETQAAPAEDPAAELARLKALRVRFLGKKGDVAALMKVLKQLPADDKRTFGQRVNLLKNQVTQTLDALRAQTAANLQNSDRNLDEI
jgi:phenylalanyl-tRNA synthetase alpha subunit